MARLAEKLQAELTLDTGKYWRSLKKAEKATKQLGVSIDNIGKVAQKQLAGSLGNALKKAQVGKHASKWKKFSSQMSKFGATVAGVRHALLLIRGALRSVSAVMLPIPKQLEDISKSFTSTGMLNAASTFNEIGQKTKVVFGGANSRLYKDAVGWINKYGAAVGRSRRSLMTYMATLQDTFVPIGMSREESAKLSQQITKLGLDVASFNDAIDSEVINNFTSAIVGNHRAVRSYGIMITQNRLEQELMNLGYEASVQKASEMEKSLARVSIIMHDTADAQGDLIRTQDEFANQMKRIAETVDDFAVEAGQELVAFIEQEIKDMGGLSKVLEGLRGVMGGVKAASKLLLVEVLSLAKGLADWTAEMGGSEAASLKIKASILRLAASLKTLSLEFRTLFFGAKFLFEMLGNGFRTIHLAVSAGIALAQVAFADFGVWVNEFFAKMARGVSKLFLGIPGDIGWIKAIGEGARDAAIGFEQLAKEDRIYRAELTETIKKTGDWAAKIREIAEKYKAASKELTEGVDFDRTIEDIRKLMGEAKNAEDAAAVMLGLANATAELADERERLAAGPSMSMILTPYEKMLLDWENSLPDAKSTSVYIPRGAKLSASQEEYFAAIDKGRKALEEQRLEQEKLFDSAYKATSMQRDYHREAIDYGFRHKNVWEVLTDSASDYINALKATRAEERTLQAERMAAAGGYTNLMGKGPSRPTSSGRWGPWGTYSLATARFHGGGLVNGPAGIDRVAARLTAGEYVMPREVTIKNLAQLEAMRRDAPNVTVNANISGAATGGLDFERDVRPGLERAVRYGVRSGLA